MFRGQKAIERITGGESDALDEQIEIVGDRLPQLPAEKPAEKRRWRRAFGQTAVGQKTRFFNGMPLGPGALRHFGVGAVGLENSP